MSTILATAKIEQSAVGPNKASRRPKPPFTLDGKIFRMSVWPVASHTLTPGGSGIIVAVHRLVQRWLLSASPHRPRPRSASEPRPQTRSRSHRHWPSRLVQTPPLIPRPPSVRSRSVARGMVTLGAIGSATTAICHIVAAPPRSAAASALQNDLEFLILGPTTTPTRIHHFELLDLGTAPITVHKDSTQH